MSVKTKHAVVPLDLAILDRLPDEGKMIGWSYLGKTVKKLRQELSDEAGVDVPSSQIQTRLRICKLNGLVVLQPGGSGGRAIWQRTEKGAQLVKEQGVPEPQKPEERS